MRRPIPWAVVATIPFQLACAATAHDFVRDKTGVEVSEDVRLCANGVLGNDPTCKPSGTGGRPWIKSKNFDVFSVSPTGVDEAEALMAQVRHRYLGTPFWDDHLQPACKVTVSPYQIPPGLQAQDYIDIAGEIRKETTHRFAVEAVAKAQKLNLPVDAGAQARFQTALEQLVETKVDMKMLWFVTTYTGGRPAIEGNPNFTACRQEVANHSREGANFVTGVAGFVVLSNRVDSSVTSESTLRLALSAFLSPQDGTKLIDAGLGGNWEKTVSKVARVRASTTSLTTTVYPLWVQFE